MVEPLEVGEFENVLRVIGIGIGGMIGFVYRDGNANLWQEMEKENRHTISWNQCIYNLYAYKGQKI
jgi:hypothetical protein